MVPISWHLVSSTDAWVMNTTSCTVDRMFTRSLGMKGCELMISGDQGLRSLFMIVAWHSGIAMIVCAFCKQFVVSCRFYPPQTVRLKLVDAKFNPVIWNCGQYNMEYYEKRVEVSVLRCCY